MWLWNMTESMLNKCRCHQRQKPIGTGFLESLLYCLLLVSFLQFTLFVIMIQRKRRNGERSIWKQDFTKLVKVIKNYIEDIPLQLPSKKKLMIFMNKLSSILILQMEEDIIEDSQSWLRNQLLEEELQWMMT